MIYKTEIFNVTGFKENTYGKRFVTLTPTRVKSYLPFNLELTNKMFTKVTLFEFVTL